MNLLKYSKALVPLAVGGLVALLGVVGVTPDMRVEDALGVAITAALVWLVPNKK